MLYIVGGFLVAVVLEYFLAKGKNPYVGLVLPGLCLIATVVAVLLAPRDQNANFAQQIVQMLYALLYFNIPTLVFGMIYLRVRKRL